MDAPLVLAGCGKMGGALLEGWLARGMETSRVIVVDPDAGTANNLEKRFGVTAIPTAEGIGADIKPGVVIFAVKPQIMDNVVPAYLRFAVNGCVFLSIAAGKTIAYFEEKLGAEAAIVRCMPNLPAAVRRGITVACPNQRTTAGQQQQCGELLTAVGDVVWVDDEGLLDAVTAVSGSGPAYVFLLTECLARAGVEAGLPENIAGKLAQATVAGAGELMRQAPDKPEILRASVTSPGGTTAAALTVLMAGDALQRLMIDAVGAAARRSRELAG